MKDSFDIILHYLGTGKWTIFHAVVIGYWYLFLTCHTLAGAFLAYNMDHTCRSPPHAYTSTFDPLPNTTLTPSTTTALDNTTHHHTGCSYLVEEVTTGRLLEEPCTAWDFDTSVFTSTITSEFQLVCGKKYVLATYQSIFMFGMVVGAVCNSFLADRYGRWTMLVISTVLETVVAVGSAWLPSIHAILVARFLLGVMSCISLQAGYILVLEIVEVKTRSRLGLSLFMSMSVGPILFSMCAYLVRDWRWLQTTVSIPFLLFLPALWVMSESPRWMAVVGQHQRAMKEMKKAAAWNKVTLPPDNELLTIMRSVHQQAARRTKTKAEGSPSISAKIVNYITVLFRTPKMRIITIIMCLDYFIVSMSFFGLTLGASNLGVNPFVFMAISGAVEIVGKVFCILTADCMGRKKILFLNFSVAAIVLLAHPLVSDDLKWLTVVLVMVGKMSMSCAFNLVYLYNVELAPTEIRSQSMGASQTAARAGAFVSPYILSALEAYPWAVSVVIGMAAGVGAVSLLALWETKNTRLKDTVADLEGLTHAPAT